MSFVIAYISGQSVHAAIILKARTLNGVIGTRGLFPLQMSVVSGFEECFRVRRYTVYFVRNWPILHEERGDSISKINRGKL
jgi:hypothetical protein